MSEQNTPAIVLAAQQERREAALAYARLGFSVLPLRGKRPSCKNWKKYQNKRAPEYHIEEWVNVGMLVNIGLVCGAISDNLVVLDLDGAAGYPAFAAKFPHLADTYTVATGGGVGKHVYWKVDQIPPAVKAMNTPIGHIELCAEGRQIVAPPSIHPDTRNPYIVERALERLHVESVQEIVDWIESFKPKPQIRPWSPPRNLPTNSDLNPQLLDAVARYFMGQGFKQDGDWLHGSCIYPNNHKNGDRNPSFGYNQRSGYGYCFSCGTMLTKDICHTIGIRPDDYGGLFEPQQHTHQRGQKPPVIDLAAAPDDDDDVQQPSKDQDHSPDDKKDSEAGKNQPSNTQPPNNDDDDNDEEPPISNNVPSIADLDLPDWLKKYLDWAGTTGNQTPMSFHLAAGLWLLSVAIGRRLYAAAPWGINLYPNLYIMMIASTTYYRKSTAYKLAEKIARDAIPHMLMPTPGSPERFQEALSGQLPANFDKLTDAQQSRLKRAQPFTAP